MQKTNSERGIVKLIVTIIIGVIALSYVGIDLEQVFTTPLLKKNVNFTWEKSKLIWNEYIYKPVHDMFSKKNESKKIEVETPSDKQDKPPE